jgi:hypothetical protein
MQREHIYDVPWMETSDDKRTKKKEKKENKQTNKQIYFNSHVVIKAHPRL